MSQKLYCSAALMLLLSSSAGAFFATPSVKQTLGSGGYSGASASVDFGGDWHLKPMFNSYHSSSSSGTFNTYSVRVGYDGEGYGLGITAGLTPRVNGYKNYFAGGEFSLGAAPGESGLGFEEQAKEGRKESGLRWDLGGGPTLTIHSDQFQQTVNAAGKTVISPRTEDLDISEMDVNAFANVTVKKFLLSATVLKAVYDKDLSKLSARSAQVAHLAGLVSTVQGFPDLSATAKTEFRMAPLITPYLSYTYTQFKVTQPHSTAYTVGAYCDREWFELDASYERYAQAGGGDINYYSLGATLRF